MSNQQQHPMSVMLTAKNMQKSLAFYRDVLGFQLKECWPDEKGALWASLVLDGQTIMLGAQMSPDAIEGMCGGSSGKKVEEMKALSAEFSEHKPGVGMFVYVRVPDVDKHHASAKKKGAKGTSDPETQFYGLRDYRIEDPDGYRLNIYTPVAMPDCQWCGMPLKDVEPGTMYCGYCTDEKGTLKPYEVVFEGTTTGYFMNMHKMKRPDAEKAAREHLAKMPAWAGRK